ncbi:hypothetical protein V7O67_05220 [Methanolobus sp. ZRKC4]|uniref:hypothetical protein n=1 Tax=Methanolobus sp. ZRKC4 TaxID=3125787 RepID=UPI00324EDA1B
MLTITSIVSAVDNNSSDSELTNVEKAAEFIAQQEAARKATLVPGIDVKDLSVVKNNPYVIEARGKIPTYDAEIMERGLDNSFSLIIGNSKNDIIEKYAHPNGPVIAFGYDYGSYVSISILAGSDVDEETLDSIYNIIEQEAKEGGIENVPVVFMYEEIAIVDEGQPDTEYVDVESSTDKSENEIETETTNTTPGFSALTLIIMIFLLWRFKST